MRPPRHTQLSEDTPQHLHVYTQCVRRAYLCGFDKVTGRNYGHRKLWIEARLLELGQIFSVDVLAYVVMSNHIHLSVRTNPTAPRRWSDETVARRWLKLGRTAHLPHDQFERHVALLMRDSERLAELRRRLGSLSWYMRYLKEPIARRANREDGCTGHFWAARFHVQNALDEAAVLSQMVYIDLNPYRAGTCADPVRAPSTSVRRRAARAPPRTTLVPIVGCDDCPIIDISEADYIELVRWTSRTTSTDSKHGPPGTVPGAVPATIRRLSLTPDAWCQQVLGIQREFSRAVGSVESLEAYARQSGRRWIRGIRFARTIASRLLPTPDSGTEDD